MKFEDILNKLKISEEYTKPVKKPKTFDTVKANTYPKENYNFMADLLFLPTTKKGFRYLLVVVDLWTDIFDIEPLKNKEPQSVLDALKVMFKRKWLDKPYASFSTDGGGEFKGVLQKYLYNESIYHKVTKAFRHTQQGNVEMLNQQIGRLLNGYMNTKEEETGKQYNEWVEELPFIRNELNKYRKEKNKNKIKNVQKSKFLNEPKFKVGDTVIYQLDAPLNALGHRQSTANFRVGDYRYNVKQPRKIKNVLWYNNGWRYLLDGINNASYTEAQLKLSKDKDSKFEVKKILGKRKKGNKNEYLVWFKGYPKKSASWEPSKQLMEDGLKGMIEEYEKSK